MKLYKKHIEDEENILHLGKNLESVIVDIDADGNVDITIDKELVEEYGKGDDGEDNGNKAKDYSSIYVGSQTTKIDNKPNG
jgi:competence protein ComEC